MFALSVLSFGSGHFAEPKELHHEPGHAKFIAASHLDTVGPQAIIVVLKSTQVVSKHAEKHRPRR